MLRLILLTTAALFGVLALYGTPELAGLTDTRDQPAAEASPPRPAASALAHPAARQTRAAPVDELLQAALSGSDAPRSAYAGPRLVPSPEHAGPAPVAPRTVDATLYVAGSGVNLRGAPDASGPLVATLDKGEAVRPLGSTADAWIEVEDAAGRRGFMLARYLSPKAPG